jgi:hypothetical protein
MKIFAILLLMTTAAAAQETYWTPMPPDNMSVGALESKWKWQTGTMLIGAPTVPKMPTEEQKAKALRDAYGKQTPAEIAHSLTFGLDLPVVVTTERIIPVALPEEKNFIDAAADKTNIDRLQRKWVQLRGDRILLNNICEEHGMHKVTTRGGKSWRCRKSG